MVIYLTPRRVLQPKDLCPPFWAIALKGRASPSKERGREIKKRGFASLGLSL